MGGKRSRARTKKSVHPKHCWVPYVGAMLWFRQSRKVFCNSSTKTDNSVISSLSGCSKPEWLQQKRKDSNNLSGINIIWNCLPRNTSYELRKDIQHFLLNYITEFCLPTTDLGLVLTGSGAHTLVRVAAVGGRGDLGVPGVLGVGVEGVWDKLVDAMATPSLPELWPASAAPFLLPGSLPPAFYSTHKHTQKHKRMQQVMQISMDKQWCFTFECDNNDMSECGSTYRFWCWFGLLLQSFLGFSSCGLRLVYSLWFKKDDYS